MAQNEKPIRVLVVDDSALVRKVVTASLEPFPDIEVVGTASDPYIARDKILELNPDVMTLDIEMPKMDGITFLKVVMKHRPMRVIVMSSLTGPGSVKALEALQAGAVDVLGKPSGSYSAHEDGSRLAEKIRGAANARMGSLVRAPKPAPVRPPPTQPPLVTRPGSAEVKGVFHGGRMYRSRTVILMGASTGGTEALKQVLEDLGPDVPGICIVQHIPAYFSAAFANRLNECCAFAVREARHGDIVRPGLALVAPGGFHMLLKWRVTHYVVELNEGPKVHHQRPAVDVLFESAAKAGSGPEALAILLTGMGADGAAGMLPLLRAGAETIAQDEESCVVYGMPREAVRLGAARRVLPLGEIAASMERWSSGMALRSRPGVMA